MAEDPSGHGHGDRPLLLDWFHQMHEDETIGTVTADGGYNIRRC